MDSFNILPKEIIWDILIRLPVELVLNCKLVSKTWRNHLQDRWFLNMHASHHLHHNADSGFVFVTLGQREYIVLPERAGVSGWYYNWVGFGYLPSADQYKVVVVNELKKEPKYIEIMVYTLGSGYGWRNIGKFNRIFNYVSPEHGIFENGALHWKDGDIIWVFD
ncbi:uncharacterized protein LOC113340525 [Papaver somniferum]|uniref:uncharacterized protein LOC113340525 n=1 Tax=Papaver somniferum TaxID=3469 RepID=UPI000E704388|nr:uncharacterized protein LOC113340525 [Papaver somniferum]